MADPLLDLFQFELVLILSLQQGFLQLFELLALGVFLEHLFCQVETRGLLPVDLAD